MLSKFIAFLKDLLLIPVVFGAIALFGQSLITTERVTCELQEDQFYSCTAQDLIFGLRISERTAEKVHSIGYDLKCSESSDGRSCTAFASFKTEDGTSVQVSKRYKDPDQVRKMTEMLNSLINEKSTSINITFPPSLFATILAGLFAVGSSFFIISNALENFK